MTRAEKAAWEEYPFSPTNVNNDVWDDNKDARAIYQRGYEQADKAIIEKGYEWLKRHAWNYMYELTDGTSIIDEDKLASDFVSAMEE